MHEGGEMNVAISPLAIPILAGPSTISTAMNFVGANTSLTHILIVLIALAALCLLTFNLFVSGKKPINFIDRGVVSVIPRIMGLILSVIATQMVIGGIHGAIHLSHGAN